MALEPIIPDGMRLGSSGSSADAVKGHLFFEGKSGIRGHADWVEVDDSTIDPTVVAAALLTAVAAGGAGYRKFGPPVESWFKDDVAPAVKSTWGRVTRRRPADPQPDASE
ncbi:hypothetical protein G9E11_15400 [Arthrobacter sp. IA7]|uniref:hypothetical protein n=1 Tax=Arthrobacter ipis TaxID=2716202 RepID=UPI001682DD5C|nr:hypothetical protein [Arthrobacter ipis]MBD1543597.1 hypothetical protein [Arthrobacter ipis]